MEQRRSPLAWIVEQPGKPARLTPARGQEDLQPGEVRLQGWYAPINYKDALSLTGGAPIAQKTPLVAGQDVAGVITESRHSRLQPGMRVIATGCSLGESRNGTFTQNTITAPGDCAIELPPDWPLELAAAVGTAGFTAAYALLKMQQADQKPEDGPILVTGASGGVGSHALLFLRQKGFEIVALSRKNHCHSWLRSLGAAHTLSALPDMPLAAENPLLPPQWAGVIDTLGGQTLSYALASTQSQGNVVCVGLAQGAHFSTTVYPFILRGINLLGLTASHAPSRWRQRIWSFVFSHITPANYPIPYQILLLSEALNAAKKLISGDNFGRLVLNLGTSSQL